MKCRQCLKPLDPRTTCWLCRACNGKRQLDTGRAYPRVVWTPEMDAALRQLRRDRATVRTIAKRVGVSTALVTRRCRELAIGKGAA